jgi:hypothetical protein
MPEANDDRTDQTIRDAFAATVRPSLSPYFNTRLRAAVEEEKRRKRAAAIRVRIMRTYWVLAALTSVLITLTLPWSESPHGAWLSLLVVAAVITLPMVVVRIDLLDLILDSVRKSGLIM